MYCICVVGMCARRTWYDEKQYSPLMGNVLIDFSNFIRANEQRVERSTLTRVPVPESVARTAFVSIVRVFVCVFFLSISLCRLRAHLRASAARARVVRMSTINLDVTRRLIDTCHNNGCET